MSLIVQHRHIRELGYCNKGARDWFHNHGLDWRAFLEHGIDADKLLATGDAMAEKAVAHAQKELEVNDGR